MSILLAILIVFVLAGHLLAVNLAASGPLVSLWFEWKVGRGDKTAAPAGAALSGYSLLALIVGGILGLGLAALVWNDLFHDAMHALSRRVYFGVWELLFSLILMIGHYLWWRYRPEAKPVARITRGFIALLAGTNLIYHFPFLFIVAAQRVAAKAGPEVMTSADFRAAMAEPVVLATALHFILASFAVCGMFLMAWGTFRLPQRLLTNSTDSDKKESVETEAFRLTRWGAWLALIPTALQLVAGMLLVMQLPENRQQRLIGDDLVATALFAISLFASFGLMHLLASIAMGNKKPRMVKSAWAVLVLIIVLMCGVLRLINH